MAGKQANKQEIEGVIEPVVTGAGYELADLEWTRDGGGWVLRIFIDRPVSSDASASTDAQANAQAAPDSSSTNATGEVTQGGIGLDDCTKVSREVSATLDVHDVIKQHYTLEVSSPGLDRPLRKLAHFRRVIGQRAKVVLRQGIDGRRNFTGRVLEVIEGAAGAQGKVKLELDDKQVFELPLDDLDKANLKYEI